MLISNLMKEKGRNTDFRGDLVRSNVGTGKSFVAKSNFENNNDNNKLENLIVKRGDIFDVDLGNDAVGSEQAFKRPCLIIQNDVGNEKSTTVIIAVFTTKNKNAKNYIPTHVEINKDRYNNLKIDSMVLLEQVRTVDKQRLGKKIGFLSIADMERVDEALDISVHNRRQNNRYYSAASKFETEVFDICKVKKMTKTIGELEKFTTDLEDMNVPINETLKDTLNILLDELKNYCSKFNKNVNLFYKPIIKNCGTKNYKGAVAIV